MEKVFCLSKCETNRNKKSDEQKTKMVSQIIIKLANFKILTIATNSMYRCKNNFSKFMFS